MGQTKGHSAAAAYRRAQRVKRAERRVEPRALAELAGNWKRPDLAELQRSVVDVQLAALRRGEIDPVFQAFQRALAVVASPRFRLLDAACASGYYREVLRTLELRPVEYVGSDYSEAMVALARQLDPAGRFEVQDLTRLHYPNRSFDVVMAAGVLEHVPDYQKALAELARVSGEYLIVHRSPFHRGAAHAFTIGAQYSIETPRIFFSKRKFVSELQALGFRLVETIEVYPARGWRRLWRALRRRTTLTLVFRRGKR